MSVFEKNANKSSYKESWENLCGITKLSWEYGRKRFVLIIISALVAAIDPYIAYWFSKTIINNLLEDMPIKASLVCFFIYMGILCTSIIINNYIQNVSISIENDRIRKKISLDFHSRVAQIDLFNFDKPEFYDKYARALGETETQVIEYLDALGSFVKALFQILSTSIIILNVDLLLFLFIFLNIFSPIIFNININKIIFGSMCERTKSQRFVDYVKRVFVGNDYAIDLRSTKIGELLIRKYADAWDDLINITKRYQVKLSKLISSTTIIGISLSFAITMIYLAWKVTLKQIDISTFSALIATVGTLSNALDAIANVIPNMYKRVLFFNNYKEIYNYEPLIKDKSDAVEIDITIPHSICFKNVTFYYPNVEKPALDNVSFDIYRKDKVALVGINGSGKTTIVKLLLRLYEPQSGEILIDGIDIKNIKIESLRQSFGVVQQKFNLYALKISENILLHTMTSQEEKQVQNSLEKVDMLAYAESLVQKLDTQLTREFDDSGVVLSGGMAQRLAISRAIISNSGTIIMDEPSAALDPIAEKNLFTTLKNNFSEKTQIVISHRLTNAADYNLIIMIEEGKLVASGSHSELMAYENKYKNLYEIQLEKYNFQ